MNNMKNIEKASGWSFEEIKRALEREKIEFTLQYQRNNSDNYFRDTRIRLMTEDVPQVADSMFGSPRHRVLGGGYYLAYYKILHGFDFSCFDGNIKFHNGLLLERTYIGPKTRR